MAIYTQFLNFTNVTPKSRHHKTFSANLLKTFYSDLGEGTNLCSTQKKTINFPIFQILRLYPPPIENPLSTPACLSDIVKLRLKVKELLVIINWETIN